MTRIAFVLITGLGMGVCGGAEPAPVKPASGAATSATVAGRPDIRVVEAAGAVGYDGDLLRKRVQKAVDLNDQRNQELQKLIDDAEK